MRIRKITPHVLLIILVAVFVLINNSGLKSGLKQNKEIPVRETARVSYVVDGDTLKVLISNKEEAVRLIGIDSPEVVDERKPVQCFGKESSGKAKEILTGKTIVLESDPTQEERDEYGRLLRYIFLDGLNFNKLMISEGYAREYTFKGKQYKYRTNFIQAQREAREKNKGLWAAC